jgi:hypothetical protein
VKSKNQPPMFALWKTWLDANRLALDAQCVVTLRLIQLASGGPRAASEAQRMVTEKAAAVVLAHAAAGAALATGASLAVAGSRAAIPIRRQVRANRRRLTRTKR